MAKILVIDDELNLCRLYEQELADEGHRVATALNGKTGLAHLEQEPFDLVILDLKMPQMDGIETLGKIVSKYPDLPVIINSAFSSYREDYRVFPAEAYVVKSSDLEGLVKTVREILSKRGLA